MKRKRSSTSQVSMEKRNDAGRCFVQRFVVLECGNALYEGDII